MAVHWLAIAFLLQICYVTLWAWPLTFWPRSVVIHGETERQKDYCGNTALCTNVHRAVKRMILLCYFLLPASTKEDMKQLEHALAEVERLIAKQGWSFPMKISCCCHYYYYYSYYLNVLIRMTLSRKRRRGTLHSLRDVARNVSCNELSRQKLRNVLYFCSVFCSFSDLIVFFTTTNEQDDS